MISASTRTVDRTMKLSVERGYTLIELMIGIVVGLIVLSAVIYVFIMTLKSSTNVLNSYRLNQEVASLTDVITGELRRSGYWPLSGASDSPFGSELDFNILSPGGTDTCVLYSFYNDALASAAQTTSGFYHSTASAAIYFGSGASTATCSTAGWQPLSDTSFLNVTSFDVQLDCWDINNGTSVAASSCSPLGSEVYRRNVTVTIGASLARDSQWQATSRQTVRLMNDLSGD